MIKKKKKTTVLLLEVESTVFLHSFSFYISKSQEKHSNLNSSFLSSVKRLKGKLKPNYV
jgi:hypothetical protein